jgi:hypothetical protein
MGLFDAFTAEPATSRGSHVTSSEGCDNNMIDMEITTEDPDVVKRLKQDRKVCYIRGTLIVVLVIVTIAVATFAGVYVAYDEHNNFLTQYTDSYEIVHETFQMRLDVKRDCAMTLSAMFTSKYGPLGVFPNVTTTNFE